jgi:hypothetical protein
MHDGAKFGGMYLINSGADMRFNMKSSAGANVDVMTLNEGGNVGIGTTSPASKLDVVGTAQADYLALDPQDGTNEGGELQLKGAGSFGNFQFDNYQGNARIFNLGASNYFEILGGASGPALRVQNGGAFVNGNMGIGVSSPSYKLDVSDRILLRSGSGSAGAWFMNSNNSALLGFLGTVDDNTFGFYGNGFNNWAFNINRSSGNVGIGTTSPQARLHVAGGTKIGNGSVFQNMQGGQVTVGAGTNGVKDVTLTFPNAFANTPRVIATCQTETGQTWGDNFSVTVKSVSTTSCVLMIRRTDNSTGSWGQNLLCNWMAFDL